MKKAAFISCMCLLYGMVSAQMLDDLSLTLTKSENKTIASAVQTFSTSDSVLRTLFSVYAAASPDSANLPKVLEDIHKAADDIESSVQTVYKIYRDNADVFWLRQEKSGQYPTGLEKERYMERESAKILKEASVLLTQVRKSSNYQESSMKIDRATRLAVMALAYQGRSLKSYQEYPVEYPHKWSNDITIDEVLSATKISGFTYRNIINFSDDEKAKNDTNIIFKIQIAAHKAPLTEEYIRIFYSGTEKVHLIPEDGWYRYSIGIYHSYQEAKDAALKLNIERSFIVAYKKGLRMDIKLAKQQAN